MTVRAGVEATGEFVDRKSRFIAQLVHIESEQDAAAHLAAMRARHYDARHNVSAWVLADGRERASDDGEPQRTSGMPTLEVLRGCGLRDACCVTTRYFGGTLLGSGGLVRAYTAAAQAAVEAARAAGQLVEMTSVVPVEVRMGYADHDRVLDIAQRAAAKIVKTDYTDVVCLHLLFKEGGERSFVASMVELFSGKQDVCVGKPVFAEF